MSFVRKRDRQTDRQRQRKRQTERDRGTDRQTERQTERERRETERDRERETETQREWETERETETERMPLGEIENSGLFPFFLILFHEHQWGDLHVYKALFSNLTGSFVLTVRRVICRGLHWNTERSISVHRSYTGQLELVFSRTILRMRKSLESKQFLPHYPVGLATPRSVQQQPTCAIAEGIFLLPGRVHRSGRVACNTYVDGRKLTLWC